MRIVIWVDTENEPYSITHRLTKLFHTLGYICICSEQRHTQTQVTIVLIEQTLVNAGGCSGCCSTQSPHADGKQLAFATVAR